MSWLAIDVGGTKFAAGVVGSDGAVVRRSYRPTDHRDPWSSLVAVVGEVLVGSDDTIDGCGVGCGGPMRLGGSTVSPLHIPAWREFPLHRRVSDLTGLPVVVDNDAKALALGEGWVGAARGTRDYLGMVVSTGVGAGVVLGGELVHGATGNAGHVGHVVVDPDGSVCQCGGRGCLEAEASGPAIAARTGRPAAEADPDTIHRTGTLVGRALASAMALYDVTLAVVGGSVALGFGAPFFASANAELSARAGLSFLGGARVVPAALGADAPLVGAAALVRSSAPRRPRRPL